jgi:hypothetical protein
LPFFFIPRPQGPVAPVAVFTTVFAPLFFPREKALEEKAKELKMAYRALWGRIKIHEKSHGDQAGD